MRVSFFILVVGIGLLLAAACEGGDEGAADVSAPVAPGEQAAQGAQGAGQASLGSAAAEIWIPSLNTTWQWQLNELPLNLSFDVEMYDIYLFDTDADLVALVRAILNRKR